MNNKYEIVKEPVYKQISDILKELIINKKYKVGDRFPSEREISDNFDVSRATANKAISALIAEGLLTYKKGVGTYVSKHKLNFELGTLISFTEKAKKLGFKPSTEVLKLIELSIKDIPEYEKKKLELEDKEKVYYMKRLRKADNIPVILEYRYLRSKYCPDLKKDELNGSIYNLCSNKYKLQLTGVKQSINIIELEKEESNIMNVKKGKSCLQINGIGYIDYKIPLWIEHTIYNPDKYEFNIHYGEIDY